MSFAPMALMAVLSAGAAYGSYTMTRYQGRIMQSIADQNARNLDIQAGQERAAAQHEAARKALQNKMMLGDTKAQLAGAGFALDDATSQTIIGQTVEQQTLAELTGGDVLAFASRQRGIVDREDHGDRRHDERQSER